MTDNDPPRRRFAVSHRLVRGRVLLEPVVSPDGPPAGNPPTRPDLAEATRPDPAADRPRIARVVRAMPPASPPPKPAVQIVPLPTLRPVPPSPDDGEAGDPVPAG